MLANIDFSSSVYHGLGVLTGITLMYRAMKKQVQQTSDQESDLEGLQRKIDYYIQHRENVLTSMGQRKREVEKSVNRFYNEMVARLHKLKEVTISNFRERYESLVEDCKEDIEKSREISASIQELSNDSKIKTKGSVAKKEIEDYKQAVANMMERNRHNEFVYPEDTTLKESLNIIGALGVIKIFDSDSPMTIESPLVTFPGDMININYDICFVNDTLLTLDDSSSLVATSENEKKVVSTSVNAVCLYEKDVISFTEKGQNQFSMWDMLTFERRTVKTKGEGFGISKHLDSTIISFPNEKPPRVEIIDKQGNTTLKMSHYPDGREFFQNPLYVSNANRGDIVVCDPRPCGSKSDFVGGVCITHDDGSLETVRSFQHPGTHVFYFNTDGELQWTRFLTGVSEITGVCTAGKGKIYVCGVKPRCVFHLNYHGLIRTLYPYPEDKVVVGISESGDYLVCKSVSKNKFSIIRKDPQLYSDL